MWVGNHVVLSRRRVPGIDFTKSRVSVRNTAVSLWKRTVNCSRCSARRQSMAASCSGRAAAAATHAGRATGRAQAVPSAATVLSRLQTCRQRLAVLVLLATPAARGQYAEDGANFLCRRSFGIAPAAYPLPCRAPADDYTSPLGREFVIAAWGEPTISPVDVICMGRPIPGSSTHPKTSWTYPGCNATCCNASALDQLDVYAKAHFTAVRTGLVNQFAQHWGLLPSPANASQALDALAGALQRIQQVGLRPIFTPGGFLTTRTLRGDWFGGADSFGGVSSCEMDDTLPPNNALLCTPEMGKHHLTPPELAWVKTELDKRNLSQTVNMMFLHDDDFHVTGDTIASAEWLKDNWPGAPGMINGGLTDPLGLYSSRQFVLSAEQYYISHKGTINYNISGPQGMLRTLLLSYTQSQQMAERFRLRPWPLFSLGDGMGLKAIESDSFVRVQVYAALALGAKGLDYYTWSAGVWNTAGTLPLPNNQSKGIPGLNYPIVCVVNADAKVWGNMLITARHVGAISTMPPQCSTDAECAPTCAGGTLKNTVPRVSTFALFLVGPASGRTFRQPYCVVSLVSVQILTVR